MSTKRFSLLSRVASILGFTASTIPTGADVLRDMFSRVNNRQNGYEHVLARRRGKRIHPSTLFRPEQRHGLQERLRRQRQMEGKLLPCRNLNTGATALTRVTPGSSTCLVQMDDLSHPHSHGWHEHPAKLWEVRPAGGFHTPKRSGPGSNHQRLRFNRG